MSMVGVIIWKIGNLFIIWKIEFRRKLNDLLQICKRSLKQDSWLAFNILFSGDCHTIYLLIPLFPEKIVKGTLKGKKKKKACTQISLEIAYISLKNRKEKKSGVIKFFNHPILDYPKLLWFYHDPSRNFGKTQRLLD